MGPYLWIWRCHSRALARSVAATLDMSQYRTKPTMRRKPTGIAARACARQRNHQFLLQQNMLPQGRSLAHNILTSQMKPQCRQACAHMYSAGAPLKPSEDRMPVHHSSCTSAAPIDLQKAKSSGSVAQVQEALQGASGSH